MFKCERQEYTKPERCDRCGYNAKAHYELTISCADPRYVKISMCSHCARALVDEIQGELR